MLRTFPRVRLHVAATSLAAIGLALTLAEGCSSSPPSEHSSTNDSVSSASSGLTRTLYILNQQGDAAVADFFKCVLGNTNWNSLANTYPDGESAKFGSQVYRSDNPCGTDFQCAVNVGRFNVTTSDIVLIVVPDSGYGGQNGRQTVTNPVTHAGVSINTAFVRTSPDPIYQTIYGGHEVFEAQTDGVSADCCDGETSSGGPFPWCGSCGPYNGGNGACGQYAPGGRIGTLGIDTISCPTRTFKYQQVSPFTHEFDGTCIAIVPGGGGGSDPCKGVSSSGNGVYCGSSNQAGFGGGSPTELFNCQNGRTASTSSCQFGCFVAPPGKADGCDADPCAGVPSSGNGVYCGSSNQDGFRGGSSRLLYTCQNGRSSSTQTCGGNCIVAPPGQPDHC